MIVQRYDESQKRWRYFKLEKVKSGMCKEVGETDEVGILLSEGGVTGKRFFGRGDPRANDPWSCSVCDEPMRAFDHRGQRKQTCGPCVTRHAPRDAEGRAKRFNWPSDEGPGSPKIQNAELGDLVSFGRPNGQKTKGRVVKINLKSVKVETTERSGKRGQVRAGVVYRVHPSLVTILEKASA